MQAKVGWSWVGELKLEKHKKITVEFLRARSRYYTARIKIWAPTAAGPRSTASDECR